MIISYWNYKGIYQQEWWGCWLYNKNKLGLSNSIISLVLNIIFFFRVPTTPTFFLRSNCSYSLLVLFLSYVVPTQLACVVITIILEHNQSTNNQTNSYLYILTDKEYIVKHFVILERISLPYVNEDERIVYHTTRKRRRRKQQIVCPIKKLAL